MIHSVYSSLPTFKSLNFNSGLNILLADKTPEATDRQTRNRAGKSSLIEIIHFLMGANLEKDSIFKDQKLKEHFFAIKFDLGGYPVSVERKAISASVLQITNGGFDNWLVKPSVDRKTGETIIRNSYWRTVLGRVFFDLSESRAKYGPTFRSLFPYFVRRQSQKGFMEPFRQSEDQRLFDQQVAATYLLDLDWHIPQEWQIVREREKSIKALRAAALEGTFGEVISTTSDLRTRLAIAEAHAEELRRNLVGFRVLPEYRQLEQESSGLTRQIADYINNNLIDRQLLDDLNKSLTNEVPPPTMKLEEIYKEAGVVLPGIALKRIEDVRSFHESVLANRRSYLQGEIIDARTRVEQRERVIQNLENRRSQIMSILQSHGALDHFSKLQGELTRLEQEVESLRQRYITAEALETGRTELTLERQKLLLRLQQNYREQDETIRDAILTFEEISRSLYEEAGSLVIRESDNGPEFEIKIHGKRSQGIANMQIFCFDMMLMMLCARRGKGPGFLVHDSHLFDGVDSRQIAKALQKGAQIAKDMNFQYIVTLNSDMVPREFTGDFAVDDYILPVRLTDATDDGGLFGIRFS